MAYDGSNFEEIEDTNLEEIALEEAEKQAIRTQNEWIENLKDAGWKNTGEGLNDIAGSLERLPNGFRIGTDKIQNIIAEGGRAPGTFPNVDAIAEWVNEQTNMPNRGDADFDNTVFNVGKAIKETGIEPIRAGRNAFEGTAEEYEKHVQERLE